MTLIVSALTNSFAIQVADTKLTVNGKFYADELVKMTIVRCLNVTFALSYAGLAEIDGKRTDLWLVDELLRSGVTGKDFQEIPALLRDALTRAIPKNPWLGIIGLTLRIVGLGVGLQGKPAPVQVTITNSAVWNHNHFADTNPKGRSFQDYHFDPGPNFTTSLDVCGAIDRDDLRAINGLRKNIEKVLSGVNALASPLPVLESLVTMLRLQGKSPKHGHLIGRDCTGVIIKNDYSTHLYFRSDHPTQKRFANLVRNGFAITNLEGKLLS